MFIDLRKRADLTQQELADKSGINIRRIQKIESGEIEIDNITLKTAFTLASALKLTLDDFYKGAVR